MSDYLDLLEAELRRAVVGHAHAGTVARGRLRRRVRAGARWAVPAAAGVVAVVIAAVALVLVRHRTPIPTGSTPALAHTRGMILDSDGGALAGDRPVREVLARLAGLPASASARARELARLAGLLGISTSPIRCVIATPGAGRILEVAPVACEVAQAPTHHAASVVIATDLSARTAGRVQAERRALPGIRVERVAVRAYPHGSLAAQLLGTVGLITPQERRLARDRGLPATAVIGQSGLEDTYDAALRRGENVRLSINTPLQRVAQTALAHAVNSNHADAGAFVVMNPQTGAILAMGSAPTYNPSAFTQPLSQTTYRALFGPSSGDPLLDRAIQSAGSVGSTFAPITALAALQSGDWHPDQTYDDTGAFCVPATSLCLHNNSHAAYGPLTVSDALRVADSTFFYNLGARTNSLAPNGGPVQTWARLLGIGALTGIDLPGEITGTLPTPQWRANLNQLEHECDTATGPFTGDRKRAPGGCGIATYPFENWTVGDNINEAVGQGDIQVTPLQLAVAYAALANGGTVVTPHLASDIQTRTGTILDSIHPAPKRHLAITPANQNAILQGLRTTAIDSTSGDVMHGLPAAVYGHTGTAQTLTAQGREENNAWYAGFIPAAASSKAIVVIVTVHKGGYGDVAAAPVARQILSQWLTGKPGPWRPGTAHTL